MTFSYRFVLGFLAAAALHAQTLELVSGHGQAIREQTREIVPFVLRVVNSSGQPVPNVPISWSVSPASAGTLMNMSAATNEQGEAQTGFTASNNQPRVSFTQATITARSPYGNLNFALVVSLSRDTSVTVGLPFVQPIRPTPSSAIEGAAGTVLPGAVSVRVVAQGGISVGQPVPGVGLRVEPTEPSTGPTAMCNAPGGVVLTGRDGVATCDLLLGSASGSVQMKAVVGDYNDNLKFDLRITRGSNCSFSVFPISQNFGASGGPGAVNVTAGPGCSWTASSSAPWIAVNSGSTGQGNGTVSYSVAANNGQQRSATLAIAGRTVTISQAAVGTVGGASLAYAVAASLPSATAGVSYSVGLPVNGGTPPYRWIAGAALPPGLALNTSTGVISGAPSAPGTYAVPVSVADASNASVSQTFTLLVSPGGAGAPPLAITTSAFPAGVVGAPYEQHVATSGGCNSTNPFAGPPVISLASGALPPGLSLQPLSSGYGIAGTPTAPGNYAFAIRAASCAEATLREYTMSVRAMPVVEAPTINISTNALRFEHTLGSLTVSEQIIEVTSPSAENVAFTSSVSSGVQWLRVSPPSGQTPASVRVIVNSAVLLPGVYDAFITFAPATNPLGPRTVHVILSVTSPPIVQPNLPVITSVTNAASFATAGIAPGQFITIFGVNLQPFGSNSSDTRVLFDDAPAPLIYVSPTQISAIAPYGLSGRGSTRVVVEHGGGRSASVQLPVVESAPGIFTLAGTSQGAILNEEGTVNGFQGTAARGSIVSIYATGEGLTMPRVVEGTIASADNPPKPVLPVGVQIGGVQAEVLYAGSSPGLLVGVLQVNARVPENTRTGSDVPVILTIGNNISRPVTMAIH